MWRTTAARSERGPRRSSACIACLLRARAGVRGRGRAGVRGRGRSRVRVRARARARARAKARARARVGASHAIARRSAACAGCGSRAGPRTW